MKDDAQEITRLRQALAELMMPPVGWRHSGSGVKT
jgi:hypothetical protein